jgi:hypothetical protein
MCVLNFFINPKRTTATSRRRSGDTERPYTSGRGEGRSARLAAGGSEGSRRGNTADVETPQGYDNDYDNGYDTAVYPNVVPCGRSETELAALPLAVERLLRGDSTRGASAPEPPALHTPALRDCGESFGGLGANGEKLLGPECCRTLLHHVEQPRRGIATRCRLAADRWRRFCGRATVRVGSIACFSTATLARRASPCPGRTSLHLDTRPWPCGLRGAFTGSLLPPHYHRAERTHHITGPLSLLRPTSDLRAQSPDL